jgi:hypothetical protein
MVVCVCVCVKVGGLQVFCFVGGGGVQVYPARNPPEVRRRFLRGYARGSLDILVPAYVSVRQHTSAYVSIRQHTSAHGYARGALDILVPEVRYFGT